MVRFSLKEAATTFAGDNAGGTCCSGGDRTNSNGCSDHFGANITLTSNWTLYSYTWAQLGQAGFGVPVTFDPKAVIGVGWQVSDAAAYNPFDIWVDVLEFF